MRRRSTKRNAILELIRSTKTHPGAQWVYDKLKPQYPDLSLGTVYRNIKILVAEGELASAGVLVGEEHFDGVPEPHSHAICTRCRQITDLDEAISPAIADSFPKKNSGFVIDIRKTVFYGLCNNCFRETAALGR